MIRTLLVGRIQRNCRKTEFLRPTEFFFGKNGIQRKTELFVHGWYDGSNRTFEKRHNGTESPGFTFFFNQAFVLAALAQVGRKPDVSLKLMRDRILSRAY